MLCSSGRPGPFEFKIGKTRQVAHTNLSVGPTPRGEGEWRVAVAVLVLLLGAAALAVAVPW